ncbi:MAG TPA: ATP-binding cassette domain-containing protein [Candidatus Baltobacteraceae bacterium]|nr:ATP-binding cassette domain-containing protein [Candidatus Baltobacteraceae bacterium]
MAIIEAVRLRKVFRSPEREPGLRGAAKALFTRRYTEKVAVDDVSFSLEPGELVGYIGPNGAGKSTTIKMLTGILVPSGGTLRVAGLVPYERRMDNAANIGAVFGQRSQLYWDLPLRESFELLRAIYDVPRERFERTMKRFAEMLDLEDFLGTPVRQLSLGERMRGDFAAAMLHDPPIVYLDEPTIGLDVVAKEAIREFIAQINRERGTTVILTTHDLADVERLARRIILIDDGRVIYDGGLERLREEYGTHRTLVVTLAEPCEGRFDVPGAEVASLEGCVVRLRFNRRELTAEALIRRVTERYTISDVSIIEPDIESIVRRIYLEGYHEGAAATPS